MKNLFNYLNESVFKGSAFYNHNYAKDVIAQICNTGTIRLGAKGETTFTIPADIHEKVQSLRFRKLNAYHWKCSGAGVRLDFSNNQSEYRYRTKSYSAGHP